MPYLNAHYVDTPSFVDALRRRASFISWPATHSSGCCRGYTSTPHSFDARRFDTRFPAIAYRTLASISLKRATLRLILHARFIRFAGDEDASASAYLRVRRREGRYRFHYAAMRPQRRQHADQHDIDDTGTTSPPPADVDGMRGTSSGAFRPHIIRARPCCRHESVPAQAARRRLC